MRIKYFRFYRLLVSQWRKGALVLFLSSAVSVLNLGYPFIAKLLIDKAYAKKDIGLFFLLMATIGGIFVLASVINASIQYVSRYLEVKINFELKRQVFGKLQKIPYLLFQKYSTGKHLYSSVYDIDYVTYLVSNSIPQLVFAVPRFLFIFGIVFYLNRPIALFFLLLLPLVYIMCVISARLLKRNVKEWVENSEKNFEYAQEMLSHYQLIRSFGTQRHTLRHYLRSLARNFRINMTNAKTNVTISLIDSMLQRAAVGVLVIYGGLEVMKGTMSLGTLSAIALYLGQLAGFQGLLTNSFYHLTLGMVSCERLEEILDMPIQPQGGAAGSNPFTHGAIELKDVSFSYVPGQNILNNINVRIGTGSFVAFVGPSGCGKTTVVNLMMRLLKPAQGRILIGDTNIESFDSASFFGHVGVVLQEPLLWNDTIFNNIRYGRDEATAEEVREAAGIACISEFIDGLEQGYETVIGENACRLSEGQKQRIAVARALVKKPKILIVDEGLSSVDGFTEEEMLKRIRGFLQGSTVIVISHRLSTIALMDSVFFFAQPDLIVAGHHSVLLRDNSVYQKYLAHQIRQ